MPINVKRLLAFFGLLAVAAGVFWLGGFNFDRRGPDVAFSALFTLCLAILATTFPFED